MAQASLSPAPRHVDGKIKPCQHAAGRGPFNAVCQAVEQEIHTHTCTGLRRLPLAALRVSSPPQNIPHSAMPPTRSVSAAR